MRNHLPSRPSSPRKLRERPVAQAQDPSAARATFARMSSQLTDHDRELLRSELTPQIDEILRDAGELERVEELERFACELLLPFQGGEEGVAGMGEALVEAVAASDAPAAADLLAAFAVLGPGELASAAEAVPGGPSRFEGAVAALEPRAAARVREGAAEILQVRFERPASGEYQLAGLFLELEGTGGAALGGMVTAPTAEPEPFLPAPGGGRPRAIPVGEVAELFERALARTAELGLAVERELGVCLPLIARALTGSADGLPAVDVELTGDEPEGSGDGESGPLYVDPLDEDAYTLIEQGLLSELDDYLDDEWGAFVDHAPFFAGSLLHWKWGYADGRLGTWTCADLAEFMLDYAPRKLPSDDETLAAAPGCLALFLRFLDDRGSLAGDPLADLLAEVDRLSDQLGEAARDPGNWGMAKSLTSQMAAEGVDLGDQGALDAWMEDFNSRPFEERDRVLGPALDGMASTPAPPVSPQRRGPTKAERRGKRKQARAARRRNR